MILQREMPSWPSHYYGGRVSFSTKEHSNNLDREEEISQSPSLSLGCVVHAPSMESIASQLQGIQANLDIL